MMKIKTRKIIVVLISVSLILVSCNSGEKENKAKESKIWISLFNGKDLNDWKIKFSGHELNDNVKNTFRAENGLLKVSYDQYNQFENKFGHIFYKEKFSQYIIKVEYRFVGDQVADAPGWAFRNNGIMFHSQSPESMDKDQDFPVSVEVQLLGGNGTDQRSTANVCTPGTHIVMNGELITDHCISSKSKTFHGDQWVTVEVEVRGNKVIKHIVNGVAVMEYNNPQLDEEDPFTKSMMIDGVKLLSEGYIALQAESHPTEFRKVELLKLDK